MSAPRRSGQAARRSGGHYLQAQGGSFVASSIAPNNADGESGTPVPLIANLPDAAAAAVDRDKGEPAAGTQDIDRDENLTLQLASMDAREFQGPMSGFEEAEQQQQQQQQHQQQLWSESQGGERRRSISVGRSVESEMTADILMEFVVEKLKLLNYEKDFCRRRKPPWPLLHRFYFAMPSGNPNEQFFYFSSLVSWLLGLAGRKVNPPGQFDDPNATCISILVELRDLGFAQASFPPAKLKQGYGDLVCSILDGLASFVLEKQRFVFRPPIHPSDEGIVEETDIDVTADDMAEIAEEMVIPGLEEEEPFMQEVERENDFGISGDAEATAVLESKVDPHEWKLELERVGPQLRVTAVADVKDWRTHLDQTKQMHEQITKHLPECKFQLEKVESEVASALEKLGTREKYINTQLDQLTQEYRAVRNRLSEVQDKHNKSMVNVSELTNELARVTEELERVKRVMDERGNDISDASPLINIKNAIQRLKAELKQMEVRIGVVEHNLLQVNLKQRNKANSAGPAADSFETADAFH
ncbi:hypothetical protein CBR_g17666 [Chara braunii]|uniref:Intraflagellar transport protein 57 n=1 Tax=Chara braunii TaxID=69332 RepID=A0A388KV80_CHABU|nr:hypothetical protein CBR_g17666 [Chara braunii]|eukprot:GBG73951.1 hypothetical protein CBR_g17666 [Chara braunii]